MISRSISSRSIDSITNVLTMPAPGAACIVTSTLPKKIEKSLAIVGPSLTELIWNKPPFGDVFKDPEVIDQSCGTPLDRSTE